jgi:glycosyltransferase involved in cell wall biosynthesis
MVCCWLSQDASTMGRRELRSVGRSLAGVTRVVVFSSNQVPIIESRFGVPPDRIDVVPFGVDTSYYDPSRVEAPAGGGGVVAVGSDSRRDYATLFEAARLSGIHMTVACQQRNLAGLSVPENVQIVSAYGEAYRRLLHSADLVVTPTSAPAYPSGQSVVLEAMSMGRATLTTDSEAMREYVTDGWNGALMPVRDVRGVADRITALMEGPADRENLGHRGADSVRAKYDIGHMWSAIDGTLHRALA